MSFSLLLSLAINKEIEALRTTNSFLLPKYILLCSNFSFPLSVQSLVHCTTMRLGAPGQCSHVFQWVVVPLESFQGIPGAVLGHWSHPYHFFIYLLSKKLSNSPILLIFIKTTTALPQVKFKLHVISFLPHFNKYLIIVCRNNVSLRNTRAFLTGPVLISADSEVLPTMSLCSSIFEESAISYNLPSCSLTQL